MMLLYATHGGERKGGGSECDSREQDGHMGARGAKCLTLESLTHLLSLDTEEVGRRRV